MNPDIGPWKSPLWKLASALDAQHFPVDVELGRAEYASKEYQNTFAHWIGGQSYASGFYQRVCTKPN